RRTGRFRFPLSGGVLVLVLGVACLAPLAPTALAPLAAPAAPTPPPEVIAAPPVGAPPVVPAAVVVPPLPAPAGAPAPPTPLPVPTAPPTLSPTGAAVLASITSDRTAQWVKNHTETPLRSGPGNDSQVFTQLPQWTLLKQLDSKPDWLMVQYSG